MMCTIITVTSALQCFSKIQEVNLETDATHTGIKAHKLEEPLSYLGITIFTNIAVVCELMLRF